MDKHQPTRPRTEQAFSPASAARPAAPGPNHPARAGITGLQKSVARHRRDLPPIDGVVLSPGSAERHRIQEILQRAEHTIFSTGDSGEATIWAQRASNRSRHARDTCRAAQTHSWCPSTTPGCRVLRWRWHPATASNTPLRPRARTNLVRGRPTDPHASDDHDAPRPRPSRRRSTSEAQPIELQVAGWIRPRLTLSQLDRVIDNSASFTQTFWLTKI